MLGLLAVALAGLLVGASPADQRDLDLRLAETEAELGPSKVVDDLVAGTVLDVVVRGGEPNASGLVEQCDPACSNRYPVRFDDDGTARFQYQLVDRGDCGATASCTLRVTAGTLVATAFIAFGGPALPAPDVQLSPAGELLPGEEATVTVSGLVPGTPVRVSWCDVGCDRTVVGTADAAGRAALTVAVGERCTACGFTVLAGPSRTIVRVAFEEAPTARYDGRRVVTGLGVAVLLLAGAWWLIVATDWRPPSEAAVIDPGE